MDIQFNPNIQLNSAVDIQLLLLLLLGLNSDINIQFNPDNNELGAGGVKNNRRRADHRGLRPAFRIDLNKPKRVSKTAKITK